MFLHHKLRRGGDGAAGGSSYTTGTYYPMFGVKAANYSGNTQNGTAEPELSFRRALSFDTTNTTDLDGTESLSTLISRIDNDGYICDSSFGASGFDISGIKIRHYASNGTTLEDEAEFTFTGTSFNIYDDACNVQTNLAWANPSALGTISTATINGTSVVGSSYSAGDYVLVNSSSSNSRGGSDGWLSDNADYCFLGVSDKRLNSSVFGSNSDSLDTGFAATNGLVFGISDSDGAPSSGQAVREGFSRRNSSYYSLLTNWQVYSNAPGHGGKTLTGYFIVYGKKI